MHIKKWHNKKCIYELFPIEDEDKEKYLSNEFKEIIKYNKNFTINKTLSIFKYYQQLIFENIINFSFFPILIEAEKKFHEI